MDFGCTIERKTFLGSGRGEIQTDGGKGSNIETFGYSRALMKMK